MNARHLYAGLIADGMTPARARAFFQFHKEHPWVWPAFNKAVEVEMLAAQKVGRMRISAKACWETVRRTAVKTHAQAFALNNNLCSDYARAWVIVHPVFRDVFEFRNLKKSA